MNTREIDSIPANRIPTPLFSVVCYEETDDGNLFVRVKFRKLLGGYDEHLIPRGRLEEPHKARVDFANRGAEMPNDWQQTLDLLRVAKAPKFRVTRRGGWHGDAFATRYGVFGRNSHDLRIESGPFAQKRRTNGDYQSASAGLGPLLNKSDFLIFAFLLGLTPPLAARIGRTGGFMVCFRGESSTGKTLSARTAHSLVDRAEEADLASFGHTMGVTLDSLPAFGGLCLCFGDVKAELNEKATVEKLRTLAFNISGGTSRRRKYEPAGGDTGFLVSLLSTERSVKKIFADNGVRHEDGETVRLIEIPVPDRADGGIFAGGVDDTGNLANDLARVLSQEYGTILPRYIRGLSSFDPTRMAAKIEKREQRFVDRLGKLAAHHERIARRFALVAVVGETAVTTGLLKLSHKRVREAVYGMFQRAADEDRRTDANALAPWHQFFSIIDGLHFENDLNASFYDPDTFAGFRRRGDPEILLLRLDVFDRMLDEKSFMRTILPELKNRGCLHRSAENLAKVQEKRKGFGRHWYHTFDAKSLDAVRSKVLSAPGSSVRI